MIQCLSQAQNKSNHCTRKGVVTCEYRFKITVEVKATFDSLVVTYPVTISFNTRFNFFELKMYSI